METTHKHNELINKLKSGIKFGIYDGGRECYFEDGTKVDYSDLWEALRIVHNLPNAHNKTLYELCPGTYMGVFSYKFHKFMWTKMLQKFIPRLHHQTS